MLVSRSLTGETRFQQCIVVRERRPPPPNEVAAPRHLTRSRNRGRLWVRLAQVTVRRRRARREPAMEDRHALPSFARGCSRRRDGADGDDPRRHGRGSRRQVVGPRRPLGAVACRQHRRRGRAAERRAEGGRQRQDGQGGGVRRAGDRLRRRRARHPQGLRGRTRGRTSTSPRTNGSASSPSPATPWTSRNSSRRTRGPSPT